MDDKKFLLLLAAFGAVSLALVLGLGALVFLDSKGHKDASKSTYSSSAGGTPIGSQPLKSSP